MRVVKKKNKGSRKNLTIRRLSTYLRTIDHLRNKGIDVVSSSDLEKIEGFTQSLVRRDLSEFGSFGVRGVGYNVAVLREQIAQILGFDRHWNVVLIGSGEFSDVLIHSEAFCKRNLEIVQIFSSSVSPASFNDQKVPVHSLELLEEKLDISTVDIAIVVVPPPEVQKIIDRLGQLGVRGALYFASRPVDVPKNMIVLNMDITIELGMLTHQLCHGG